MSETKEIIEKSISERLSVIWPQLSRNQRRFAVALQEHPTKKDAAISIGLEPATVYGWNGIVAEAAELLSQDVVSAAQSIIVYNGTKAAMIKAAGLDSDSERTRQDSASEILDRVLGKPTQRQEISGKDGEPVQIKFIDYGLDDDTD